MDSPTILDFAALLQPIAGSAPTGNDPRQDLSPNASFGRLKSARSQASAAERAGATDPEAMQQSLVLWRSIGKLSTQLLATTAKDLQVGAWLIESLARTKGFAGLRDGFRLARELCEQFWDDLHPRPDEDGISTRVSPLTGLNGVDSEGTLIAPIARIPITAGGEAQFATWQWTKATTSYQGNTADENYEQRRTQYETANLELKAKVEAAVRSSGADFYVALDTELGQALDEFDKLVALLDQKCGQDSPPSSSIRGAISATRDTVRTIAKDLLPSEATPDAGGAGTGGGASGAGGGSGPSGVLNTREAAFAQLKRVADFFRRTEPHSPISYMVEQAVRYGGLTLPELLVELIPDDGARSAFFTRTGIRPPTQSTS